MYRIILLAFLAIPLITFANSVQQLVTYTLAFIQNTLLPFILGIAFLIFVYNAVRFFIIGGATDDGQENGKMLVLYSILAFVVILSFWGIINILTAGIWGNSSEINPDCHFKVSDYIVGSTDPCTTNPYSY